MQLKCEVSDKLIRELISEHLQAKLGLDADVKPEDIKVLVRSKQNYQVKEWEAGELLVSFEGDVYCLNSPQS